MRVDFLSAKAILAWKELTSKGYLVKDKDGDYSIDMIPRSNEVHSVVLNVKYCPVCGKKLL